MSDQPIKDDSEMSPVRRLLVENEQPSELAEQGMPTPESVPLDQRTAEDK